MKKYDEGYVLVYVMVVLVVFCLVAATILTSALRNLNHQQYEIAKMKDQYAAEGMIEKVVALLDKGGDVVIEEYAKTEADNVQILEQLLVSIEIIDDPINDEDDGIYLTMTAKKDSSTVSYVVKLDAEKAEKNQSKVTITKLKDYTFVPQIPEVEVQQ